MPEKHKIGLLACLLLAMLLLVGCHAEPEQITEITVVHGWGSTEEDHAAMRRIYQDFQTENPDIRLNLLSLPTTDELIRKVEDSIMVGEIFDVIFLAGSGRDSIYQYMVDYDCALDLMPYIREDPDFAASLPPSALAYWETDDHRLFTISDVLMLTGGYWYNREVAAAAGITQVPTTWEEFEAACAQVMAWAEREQNDVKALQLSTEGYLYFTTHMLAQKGMEATKRKVLVDPDKLMETLKELEQIHAYSVNDSGDYNYRDETSLFNEGKLAIYVNGVWGASMISEDLDVAYALLPGGEHTISCESSGVGYILGRTGDSARQEASVRFLKYMMSPAVQQRILLETQQVPANPSIDMEQYRAQMPRFCQAVETARQAATKIEIPSQLWSNRQIACFEQNIVSVLSGQTNKQTLIDLLK